MIVIYHHHNSIVSIDSFEKELPPFSKNTVVAMYLMKVAAIYPNIKIVWCHQSLKEMLRIDFILKNKSYNNTLYSYNPSSSIYLTEAIAYVENSPFMNVNKTVKYPTWLMSGQVGYAHASVFLSIAKEHVASDFDYFLNSIAKSYMPLGLFCYSEPQLLKSTAVPLNDDSETASTATLFKFVKQHFKTRWVFLLLLDFWMYEKKLPLLSFLKSFIFSKLQVDDYTQQNFPLLSNPGITIEDTIDVLIPTIGRATYLYEVLMDLKQQTVMPHSVIIIEQNADVEASTDLDYLYNESWPFVIHHQLIHQLGACNARNLALKQLQSKWVFFADDDIRLEADFLEKCLENCKNYGQQAITVSCLQEGEVEQQLIPVQWESFGSGCSFVAKQALTSLQFDMRFEFGFGEDVDFGKKIRDKGTDVVFFPSPHLIHLKAPIGGFRTKFELKWKNESIQPKPSPTVMLYKLLYCTPKELRGYKTVLFFKYYPKQKIKNPFAYASYFKKQWNQSVYWANQLGKFDS